MQDSAPPRIFATHRRLANWHRARQRQAQADAARYLLDDAIDDILDRIGFMQLEPGKAFISGDLTGRLGRELTAMDFAVVEATPSDFDEEAPFPISDCDLVVHLLGLGMVNDLPGALIHSRLALTEGGILFASFPGAGSLAKLRQIMQHADGDRPAARLHPQVDRASAAALLQRAGFRKQVVDSHPVEVRYSSLKRLIGDLRDHGLGSALRDAPPPLSKPTWDRARRSFAELADRNGKLLESFDMLTLTGWR